MAEHYFPDRRVPYERDGTRVFYRALLQTARDPDVFEVDRSYYEIPARGLEYLNGERRYAVRPDTFRSGSLVYDLPWEFPYEFIFVFPEPIDLSGIFLAFGMTYDLASVTLSASRDTTAIDDGTWSEIGAFEPSVRKWFATMYDVVVPEMSGLPVEENDRARSYRLSDDTEIYRDLANTSDRLPALDVAGTYRFVATQNGLEKGIQPLYGDDLRGIVALRIALTNQVRTSQYVPSFQDRVNFHLYGQYSGLGTQGIEIVNEDGSRLDANDLVWGNVPRTMTSTRNNYFLPGFRVHNYSASATAEDVVLHLTQPADQDNTEWLEYDSPLEMFAWSLSPTGPWNVKDPFGDPLSIEIGTLAPDESSDPIYIRLQTPGLNNDLYRQDGPGQVIFDPRVGAWS